MLFCVKIWRALGLSLPADFCILSRMTDTRSKFILALTLFFALLAVVMFLMTSNPLSFSTPSATPTEAKAGVTETITPAAIPVLTVTGTPPVTTRTPATTYTPVLPTPTFTTALGRVSAERTGCLYGPGPYILLASLRKGNNVTVLGKDITSDWLFVSFEMESGDIAKCWVEARTINLNGDAASLENYYPGKYQIPFWGGYQPPQNIRISRMGDFVSIIWDDANHLELAEREGAQSPQFLVEAWVCREAVLEYVAIGILDNTNLILEDQAGCADPSSGLLYAAGKQGYSAPVELTWPAP